MKTLSVYECDFCGRYGKTKKPILKHEERCYYNPNTRSCGTCVHLNDWTCSRGVVFENKENRQTQRLRTRCITYENIDDVAYGPDEDFEFNKNPVLI